MGNVLDMGKFKRGGRDEDIPEEVIEDAVHEAVESLKDEAPFMNGEDLFFATAFRTDHQLAKGGHLGEKEKKIADAIDRGKELNGGNKKSRG